MNNYLQRSSRDFYEFVYVSYILSNIFTEIINNYNKAFDFIPLSLFLIFGSILYFQKNSQINNSFKFINILYFLALILTIFMRYEYIKRIIIDDYLDIVFVILNIIYFTSLAYFLSIKNIVKNIIIRKIFHFLGVIIFGYLCLYNVNIL